MNDPADNSVLHIKPRELSITRLLAEAENQEQLLAAFGDALTLQASQSTRRKWAKLVQAKLRAWQ